METLELLGVALGLATLAGINLYLTVFATGLAVQQGWIALHPQYEQLAVLGDPVIVAIAGTLFALEFFADKIPWVDSVWDAVHTFIRPVGGALLAITVLGNPNPVYDVVVGLLAGGMALTTHGAKAGTRLLVNASPEPFSNVGLSVAEDLTVLGGLALVYHYPIAALGVAVVGVGLLLWFAPRLFSAAKATGWFVWRRARHAMNPHEISTTPELPPDLEIELSRVRGEGNAVLWAAPCVAGQGADLRSNTFGWLVLTQGVNRSLDFARNAENRPRLQSLALGGKKARYRRGFLSDQVILFDLTEGRKQRFLFDRTRRDRAMELAGLIDLHGSEAAPRPIVATV